MDIIIKGVLEYIQAQEGHKQTILAGGAVRDEILGLTPNDYDLCIPSKSPRDMHDLARSIEHEFNTQNLVCKTKVYEEIGRNGNPQRLTCVYGLELEGKKIDLIGLNQEDDEDFANEVITSFDYGINMVYHNGSYLDDTNEDFRFDLENRYMSLINLLRTDALPKAIERYNRLSRKYEERVGMPLKFRAPYLEIVKERTKEIAPPKRKAWGPDTSQLDAWAMPQATTPIRRTNTFLNPPTPLFNTPAPVIRTERTEDWGTVTMGPLTPNRATTHNLTTANQAPNGPAFGGQATTDGWLLDAPAFEPLDDNF